MYWEQPSEGLAFAAMGCAADLAGAIGGGGDRFRGVQGRWRAAVVGGGGEARQAGIDAPALFGVGAFAFDGEGEADAVWSNRCHAIRGLCRRWCRCVGAESGGCSARYMLFDGD